MEDIANLLSSDMHINHLRISVGRKRTWQVTAVHGRLPMNAPTAQSQTRTPVTPHAILMPDHGTIPTRRIIERRTQIGVLDFEVPLISGVGDGPPWRADFVSVMALGKKRMTRGPTGVARSEERRDPPVVMVAWRMVAGMGGSKIPVRMFCVKSC